MVDVDVLWCTNNQQVSTIAQSAPEQQCFACPNPLTVILVLGVSDKWSYLFDHYPSLVMLQCWLRSTDGDFAFPAMNHQQSFILSWSSKRTPLYFSPKLGALWNILNTSKILDPTTTNKKNPTISLLKCGSSVCSLAFPMGTFPRLLILPSNFWLRLRMERGAGCCYFVVYEISSVVSHYWTMNFGRDSIGKW